MVTRASLHIILHFLVPAGIAFFYYPKKVIKTWLILVSTLVIDLDHLLTIPIYDPNRCSINFHPLHTYWALAVYLLLFCLPKTRILGIGLLIHFVLDLSDCFLMQ